MLSLKVSVIVGKYQKAQENDISAGWRKRQFG